MILSSHGLIASQITQFVGLLDVYSGAAAAYSLRKLRTAYTGSAIRVRRTNLDEADIGFTSTGALDTTALLAFTGTGALDNGFVTTWYDQSGNALNATQTTAANQPQIVSSGSVILDGGKPSIFSSGGTISLQRTWGVSLSNPQVFHVSKIISVNPIDSYSGSWINFGNNSLLNNHFISAPADAGTYQDIFTNSRSKYGTFNATLSERYLECYENVSTTTTRYLNGTNRGSNTFSIITPTNLILARNKRQTDFTANGNIQELIIYASGNSSNRTGIEDNINDFYSIY
jgi:hypothetical protein